VRRRLLNLLTLASAVLSGAALILWSRSYWQPGEWALVADRRYFLWSQGGRLCAGVETRLTDQGPDAVSKLNPAWGNPLLPARYADQWSLSADLAHASTPMPRMGETTIDRWSVVGGAYELHRARVFTVPSAAVAAVLAFPAGARAAAWLVGFARFCRRASRNLCHRCGYSLTGNTSGTCPECGAPNPTPVEPIS
jgi:hypothetical protein